MNLQDPCQLVAGKHPVGATGNASANILFVLQHCEPSTVVFGSSHDQVNQIMPPPPPAAAAMEAFASYGDVDLAAATGSNGIGGRWPRQETLTLLEVRSRMDSKFREATQKGPLWDEVSRIMAEEHGYHRSGKKCREKLDNLYKYYKKTKGKAGRQDGKHYRFFRQLEALHGREATESKQLCSNTTNIVSTMNGNQESFHISRLSQSLDLPNSSESASDKSSSAEGEEEEEEEEEEEKEQQQQQQQQSCRSSKRGRKSWKCNIKELLDMQISGLMEVQETWMNKMLKTLEHMEQERISREEAWRKQDAERSDREHHLWTSERAWIEARDTAIIEALEKISRKGFSTSLLEGNSMVDMSISKTQPKHEYINLVKLESCDEPTFREGGSAEKVLVEEISSGRMTCHGYNHVRCMMKCPYYNHKDHCCHQQSEMIPSPSNYVNPSADGVQERSFLLLMGEGDSFWKQRGLDI